MKIKSAQSAAEPRLALGEMEIQEWATHVLVVEFGGETDGGKHFFQILHAC